jgi:hypothetical protein
MGTLLVQLAKHARKKLRQIGRRFSRWNESRFRFPFRLDLDWFEVVRRFPDPRARYRYFSWLFHKSPIWLRSTRAFFRDGGRGFGEDAFFAQWWLLFKEFRPRFALEIGVHRGQTLAAWQRIADGLDIKNFLGVGVSPLDSSGDKVSVYEDLDYERDIRASFTTLGLQQPKLIPKLSQDLSRSERRDLRGCDLIYVDGSHDRTDVEADLELVLEILEVGGLMVMDDSALYTSYRPHFAAFAGHPGPSIVADSQKVKEFFEEIGSCGHNRVFRRKIARS